MRLRQAIDALMDYSKNNGDDINVATAKLDYEIKSGKRQDLTSAELSAARTFVLDNYNIVVNARKTGDYTIVDELIAVW